MWTIGNVKGRNRSDETRLTMTSMNLSNKNATGTIPGGEGLAWSAWAPFAEAVEEVPREPGVYVARDQTTKKFVYVGHAGPRDSSGKRKPQGLRGRLVNKYAAGRAATSGLGEAAMDRALSNPAWLRRRLKAVEAGAVWRTTDWAKAALTDAGLELS